MSLIHRNHLQPDVVANFKRGIQGAFPESVDSFRVVSGRRFDFLSSNPPRWITMTVEKAARTSERKSHQDNEKI
jgi:hypothetical protein